MSSYLIIDGYNLIHKWHKTIDRKRKSMEFARSELFNLIEAYSDYNGAKSIIIYDGVQRSHSMEDSNPMVIFSGKGEGADAVIESLVYNLTGRNSVRVVTDDNTVANLVIGMGASCVSARSFEQELKSSLSSMRDFIKDKQNLSSKLKL